MTIALYLNRFFASLADYGLMFLLPLIVFQSTGSAAMAGLAFSVEYLVKVLMGPATGLLIDRYPIIRLISASNTVRATACLCFALLSPLDMSFIAVLSLAVINGVGFTTQFMGQETLLTELTNKSRFAEVQAKIQTLEQLALVSAPVIFATLMMHIPVTWLIVTAGLLFLAAQLLFWLGTRPRTFSSPPDAQKSFKTQLRDNLTVGQHYLLKSRPLQKIVASTFLINLIYGTLLAIGAIAVTGQFQRSAGDFATLQSSGAITAIVVLTVVTRLVRHLSPTQLGFLAFCMMSLGGLVAGMASSYWMFLLGAVLVLSFDGVFNVYIRTRRMEIIARKDFGKAIGLLMIVNNLSKPLSGFMVFMLTPWFSVTQILLLATVVTVLLTLGFRLFSTKGYNQLSLLEN